MSTRPSATRNPAYAATSVRFDSRETAHPATLEISIARGPALLWSRTL